MKATRPRRRIPAFLQIVIKQMRVCARVCECVCACACQRAYVRARASKETAYQYRCSIMQSLSLVCERGRPVGGGGSSSSGEKIPCVELSRRFVCWWGYVVVSDCVALALPAEDFIRFSSLDFAFHDITAPFVDCFPTCRTTVRYGTVTVLPSTVPYYGKVRYRHCSTVNGAVLRCGTVP